MLIQQFGYDPGFAKPALLAIAFELLVQVWSQSDGESHDENEIEMNMYYIITHWITCGEALLGKSYAAPIYRWGIAKRVAGRRELAINAQPEVGRHRYPDRLDKGQS